jgi:hypothetical protein
VLLLAVAAAAAAASPPEGHDATPAAIEVRARTSQTALWVGDRLTYTVEIDCPPRVDVLVEDLAPEKLALSGLQVVASDRERRVMGERVHYQVRYQLTTYDVAAPAVAIGEQAVRYYVRRPGQRSEDAAPAGEVRIPGTALALRSTLPGSLPPGVRDARPAAPLPRVVTWARPVGVGLLLVSALPVALWAGALARRVAAARRRRGARPAPSVTRAAITELRALDTATDGGRRAAYGRLDTMLRRHLTEARGIPAPSLTAAEIASRLRADVRDLPAEAVGAVLEDCERALYGPAALLPPAERFRASVDTVEELLARGR